jgi:cytidylate kinase
MARRVVCIARVSGTGGRDVATAVADALGYRVVDEEILVGAAEREGITVEELADVERRTGVIDRLLESLAHAGGAGGYTAVGDMMAWQVGARDSGSLRELIQTSIHETAARGEVVIVSHAASYALVDRRDVLRVLVTASPEMRAARLADERGLNDKAARKAVDEDDAGRAQYLKRFYTVGQEQPWHYDLVVNTDHLTTEEVVAVLVRAMQAD